MKLKKFTVTVDYNQSLEEMITAGHYDRRDDDITAKQFPIKGNGKKEIEITLVHFNHDIESEDAIRKMQIKRYRPATIEELLALGCQQPNLQRRFPIIALSFCKQRLPLSDVPCLCSDWYRTGASRAKREFCLTWSGFSWDRKSPLAFVRK